MAQATDGGRHRPLRILTWHVHGSYLWYLSHLPHELYLPVRDGRPQDYSGRSGTFPWPDRVHEIEADDVADADFDLILTQSVRNWEVDRHELLRPAQRALPRVHIEHDPPRRSPTDERHPVTDPDALVVHVTAFNQLMWDNEGRPTTVVEHGVVTPAGCDYTGARREGVVVVNNLAGRGRRLGADVFEQVREQVPLQLFGMDATALGGHGELSHSDLLAEEATYRFFFNPIRYTSLGLAICEAMMIGMPVVGLATTELVTVIENGHNGFVHTDPIVLMAAMHELLADPAEARRLGANARETAQQRFNIDRFVRDWDEVLRGVVDHGAAAVSGNRPLPADRHHLSSISARASQRLAG